MHLAYRSAGILYAEAQKHAYFVRVSAFTVRVSRFLAFDAIIRGFFGNNYVVNVRFAQAC